MKQKDTAQGVAAGQARRTFLRGVAAVGGGAVAAGLVPSLAQAAPADPADNSAPEAAGDTARYRVTEHVARYYDTLK